MTKRESIRRLDLVEDSWYEVTKGELALVPPDNDVDLARLVLGMWAMVDQYTSTVDVEQTDLEVDRDRGIAMRIAESLALLHFGGRWESQS